MLIPAIILIHEGSLLLFVPLHGMITQTVLRIHPSRSFMRTALWTGLLYLPSAIAFGAVYLSGTPSYEMLLGICQKWNEAGAIREGSCILPPSRLSGSTLPASFEPMAWPLAQAASLTAFFISTHWKEWLLILPTLGFSLWYLARQTLYSILRSRSSESFSPQSASRYSNLFFCKYYLIPFLLALPIYLTAWDYGRWFTVTCINFTMLAVSANLPCWEFAIQKKAARVEAVAASSREHADSPWSFTASRSSFACYHWFYGCLIIVC